MGKRTRRGTTTKAPPWTRTRTGGHAGASTVEPGAEAASSEPTQSAPASNTRAAAGQEQASEGAKYGIDPNQMGLYINGVYCPPEKLVNSAMTPILPVILDKTMGALEDHFGANMPSEWRVTTYEEACQAEEFTQPPADGYYKEWCAVHFMALETMGKGKAVPVIVVHDANYVEDLVEGNVWAFRANQVHPKLFKDGNYLPRDDPRGVSLVDIKTGNPMKTLRTFAVYLSIV